MFSLGSTQRLVPFVAGISLLVAHCATSQSSARATSTSTSRNTDNAPAVAANSVEAGAGSSTPATPARLTRGVVSQTVSAGLGIFLSRVAVTPVLNGSRFVGFRLDGAEDLATWNAGGADIRVGDIIQRINGQPVERPEQALRAFQTLLIAPGIEVQGLRSGTAFRTFVAVSE